MPVDPASSLPEEGNREQDANCGPSSFKNGLPARLGFGGGLGLRTHKRKDNALGA